MLLAVFTLTMTGCFRLVTPTTGSTSPDGTGWTDTTPSTTLDNPSSESSTTPAETEQTTPSGSFDKEYLQSIDPYGSVVSDQTIRLPGGQWYDLSAIGQWTGLDNLVVEAAGTGLPTLSRYGETQQMLILDSCSSVTFRNIRFGYDEKTRGEGNEANDLPLVALLNCLNITFENCAFFGGSDAGIMLDGSERVSLVNCQFYNLDGQPVKTGASYKPSQLQAATCTFETRDSGPMPLNIRDSQFEACDWIGANGYNMPVYYASQDQHVPADKIWAEESLPSLLRHVLAGKVDYHRDNNQAITLIDNFFCSSEVIDLYDHTDRTLSGLFGTALTRWSLTGEKEEEAEPGAPLNPTLGLRLLLRTTTRMAAVVVTPAPTEPTVPAETSGDSPGSGGIQTSGESPNSGEATTAETSSSSGADTQETDSSAESTAPAETTAPTEQMWRPEYTLANLVEDLTPLLGLRSRLDSLITGTIQLDVANQALMPLLTCSLPIEAIDDALTDPLGSALLATAPITLLHDQIIPADFFADPIYGSHTANDISRLLTEALHIQGLPCALHPSNDQTCFIEHILRYQGTRLAEGTAMHRFEVRIERGVSGIEGVDRGEFPFAQLDVRADTSVMTDWLDGTEVGRLCSLPLAAQKTLILDLLRAADALATYRAPGADGSESQILQLKSLADQVENGINYVPIFIFTASEGRIEAKVALYDEVYQFYPVRIVLLKPGETWQIQSAEVIIEPAQAR